MQTTKHTLFNAFTNGLPIVLQDFNGARKPILFTVINSVEREDGSNRNWNVTGINPAGVTQTVFVQTLD